MNKIVLSIVKAIMLSCAVSVILLAVAAFVMLKIGYSQESAGVISGITYFLSSFAGGLVLGKVMETRKFIWGIGCGITYFLIVLVLSVVMEAGAAAVGIGVFAALIISVAGGMLGGMVG